MLKYLLFNYIVCMERKKEKKKKNSSLNQNCGPRCNLSHPLSTPFPPAKNLCQDHELVKSEFNPPVVCWIKVKIWDISGCPHTHPLPPSTLVFWPGRSSRRRPHTSPPPRPLDGAARGRAPAEPGFGPQADREASRLPPLLVPLQKSIASQQ